MSSFAGLTGIGHSKPYQGDAFAALGLGFANFVNSIVIRHPCVVLRRQCQVHDHAIRKHLNPATLLPIIIRLSSKDGFLSLWKGAVGNGVLWAFSRISELVIAELFVLPKSFILDGSSERFWRHVLLKASNYIICTPVIVSSFIETVRSGAGLAEDFNILEVITRGFERFSQDLFGGNIAATADRRRHSIFWLAIPTSLYQTCHFLICRYVYTKIFTWTRTFVSRKMPSERKRYHTIMPELFSTITCIFVADLFCYPLETILHRLYIQGTRTLVDNLDYGTNALMPGGRYSGIFDCFGAIIRKEGLWTLFSGVGAVFLQYALQNCLSIFVYWALDRGTRGYTSGPLRIKPIGIDIPTFNSVEAEQRNDSQFAQSSAQYTPAAPLASEQIASTSSTFPTFAQTQQKNLEHLQPDNNNPFLAALRQQKSTSAFGPMDNSFTNSSTSPYAPASDYRH